MTSFQRLWIGIPFALAAIGCGASSSAPKTVPVVGKITYNGGQWPKTAKVAFVMEQPAEGSPMQSGSAELKPDGTFKASTFDEGDGLVPGKYYVNIEAWETEPALSNGPPQSIVPAKYRQGKQSGFEVNVPKDASKPVEVNFDVPNA